MIDTPLSSKKLTNKTNVPLSPVAVKAGGAKSAAVAPGWEPWVFLDIFGTSSLTFWLLHMSLQETY